MICPLTTGADIIIGTAGNDTITGTDVGTDTYDNGDTVVDSSGTDSDTYTLTLNGAATPKATNIETVTISVASTATAAISAADLSGVNTLNVSRTNVTVGGSEIAGNKQVDITNVKADKVKVINIGAGTTALNVDQATAATTITGVVINGNEATGAVAVTGAATVNADGSKSTVTVTAINGLSTTEQARPVTINAANATGVTVADNTAKFTGLITINAAKATTITVDNATGGAVINAATGAKGSGGITVSNIDSTGATITTGAYTRSSKGDINLDGTSSTSDQVTIAAAGFITLDGANTDAIENISLSGNGAALDVVLDSSSTPKAITATGAYDITFHATGSDLHEATFTDSSTANTIVAVTATHAADLSGIAADKIVLEADMNSTVTVASGANVVLDKDQNATGGLTLASKTAKGTINLSAGNDTISSTTGLASGATVEIETGPLALTDFSTVNLDATTGKLTVTTFDASTSGVVTLTGSKDVSISGGYSAYSSTGPTYPTLSTFVAKSFSAANFTGNLTANFGTGVKTIVTGSGIDTLVFDDGIFDEARAAGADVTGEAATVYTVTTGAGADVLTITSADALSSFATDDGGDTVTVNDDNAYVIVTGAGNDTVNIGAAVDTDAIIVGGDGTDELVFGAGAVDLSRVGASGNENFGFSGFEEVNITAINDVLTINSTQLAGAGAFTLVGSSNDSLTVLGRDTTGATADVLNASSITRANSDVTVTLNAGAGNDTVTGTAKNDTVAGTLGADVIDGGAGTDTLSYDDTLNSITIGTTDDAATGVTGADAIKAVVVNLGGTVVTKDVVYAQTGNYVANGLSEVAVGTAAYLFVSGTNTKNSTNVDTLSSIENVIGTSGNDYIVGTGAANKITGGGGDDYLKGGEGVDTFVFAASSNGNDKIADFTAGSGGDVFDFTALLDEASSAAVVKDSTDATTATAFATEGTSINISNKLYIIKVADVTAIDTAAEIVSLAAGDWDAIDITASKDAVLILGANNGTTLYVYHVNASATANTTIDTGEVTLIGTVTATADAIDLLASGNYALN